MWAKTISRGCKTFTAEKLSRRLSFDSVFLFLFFLHLTADQLFVVTRLFRLKFNLFFGAFYLAIFLLRRKQLELERRVLFAATWIALSFCISLFMTPDWSRSVPFLLCYLFYLFVFFFLPFSLVQAGDEERFFSIYWSVFWIVACHGFFQWISFNFDIRDPFISQRVTERFARPNAMHHEPSFYVLHLSLLMMFLGISYLLSGKRMWPTILAFIAVLLSFTTSALVSVLIFFCASYRFAKNRVILKRWVVLFGGAAITLISLLSLFWESFQLLVFKSIAVPKEHISIVTRWQGIVRSLRIFLEHPLFGVSWGGISPYTYEKNHIEELGATIPKVYDFIELIPFEPSNILSEAMASLGIFGLCGFALLFWAFYSTYRDAMRQKLSEETRIRASALFFSLACAVGLMQVNQQIFRSYIWVHAAITYGYLWKLKRCAC